jgi:DNA-binding transcriptional LysR family regulator
MGRNRSSPAIEIEDIEAVIAVAETGSFRRAGSRLDIGQSAISRRIQRLEDRLGVSVFERRSTGAQLTGAGRRFTANTRSVITDLGTVLEEARAAGIGQHGSLSIGLIASLSKGVIREMMAAYLSAHPEIELRIGETDRSESAASWEPTAPWQR